MSDYRPCPFCGNSAHFKIIRKQPHLYPFVRCGNCNADGPQCDTKEEAIDVWNERAEDKP